MSRYEQIKMMGLDELVELFASFKFESDMVTSDFSLYIDIDRCHNCPNWFEDRYGDDSQCLNGLTCDNCRTFEDCVKAWLLKEEG